MKIIKYLLALTPLACAGLVFYFGVGSFSTQPKEVVAETNYPKPTAPAYIDEQDLWSLVTTYKQQNGLQAPTKDDSICDVAKRRLGTVPEDWSHEEIHSKWIYDAVPYNHLAENLAKAQTSADQVMLEWKQSPKHNEALLYNHPYACVECANIDGTNYCVYISASY